MEKLDSTFVPSDTRRWVRDLGDLGLSNRMVRFVRQHPEFPDNELVDRVWQELRRPLDVYGMRRLREAVESRQQHRTKPPVGPSSGQRTLFAPPRGLCRSDGDPGSEAERAPVDSPLAPTGAGGREPGGCSCTSIRTRPDHSA